MRAGLSEPDRSACWSAFRPGARATFRRASSGSICSCARPAGGGGEQDRRGRHDRAERDAGAAARRTYAAALLLYRSDHTLLYKKVAYKLDDLAPVSMIQKAFYAIVVPPIIRRTTSRISSRSRRRSRRAQLRQGRLGLGDRIAREAARERRRHPDDRRDLPRHRARDPGGRGRAGSISWSRRCGRDSAAREEGEDHRHDQPGAARRSRPMCRR